MTSVTCAGCCTNFKTQRALATHIQRQQDCKTFYQSVAFIESTKTSITNKATTLNENNIIVNDDDNCSNTDNNISTKTNTDLIVQLEHFKKSGFQNAYTDKGYHNVSVELLQMLTKANAPLYLYDQIITWSKNAAIQHNINFNNNQIPNRKQAIINLKNQHDLHGLDPYEREVQLRGSQCKVKLILHKFKQCLYSLLNDTSLVTEKNLLINKDSPFILNTSTKLDDIDSGSVYKTAYKNYVQPNSSDMLCPIIFFIDKTHTDTNGRWCLEQVRFTLGIFNRNTRNQSHAWRSLGYIADQANINALNSVQKSLDYHHMLEVILEDFKECQQYKFQWELEFDDVCFEIQLAIPVMFIIGDTDGHDKLAGRYTSRNNVARLCRYCNCPFAETDNPDFEYVYTQHNHMFKTINSASPSELQNLSVHKVNNAWKDILFCDPKRGLFGALCADILHCLQHGLFQYAIQIVFEQKKTKKTNNAMNQEFTNRCVFGNTYSKQFEGLL